MEIDEIIDWLKICAIDERKVFDDGNQADDYEQIAEWLEELKVLREKTQIQDEGLTASYLLGKNDGIKQGRTDAFNEVKNAINGITKEYIELYGVDIVELYADVVTELGAWIEEQLKEQKE